MDREPDELHLQAYRIAFELSGLDAAQREQRLLARVGADARLRALVERYFAESAQHERELEELERLVPRAGDAGSDEPTAAESPREETDDPESENDTLELDVGRVVLEVLEGELAGRRFEFCEHDTFLFGRSLRDCHAALPKDRYLSRHHFLLEVNPPEVRLRDLGSLNGTYVNGVKHGGRARHETREEGARRRHEPVDLRDGDVLKVGRTRIRVLVDTPHLQTLDAPAALPETDLAPPPRPPHPPVDLAPVSCLRCGTDVAGETAGGRDGDYLCLRCRRQVVSDPVDHLRELVRAARKEEAAWLPEFEHYTVESKIGDGGMGVVYLARDREGRPVAIKLMLSEIAVSASARAVFQRECEVLRDLHHPNVVRFSESGAAGGSFYFVMEYCNAGNLTAWRVKPGEAPWRGLGAVMLGALEGLAYAHERDVVHRDLKPANILLHREGERLIPRVSDFGLAKNFQRAGFSGMTATGSFGGTFPFMPREQLTQFKYADPASDVWGIAATFYHLLTGQYPRDHAPGSDPIEVILEGRIVPIRDRDERIPPRVAAVLDRALRDDKAERYETARGMQKELARALRRTS